MTAAADFRARLARLELTQAGAARLLGVDARTVRRWVSGDREPPPPVLRLLDLAEYVPGVLDWLRAA